MNKKQEKYWLIKTEIEKQTRILEANVDPVDIPSSAYQNIEKNACKKFGATIEEYCSDL